MVLTPPMVFAQTYGIVSVLLDHTRTRGPSVARIPDSFFAKVSNSNLFWSPGGFLERDKQKVEVVVGEIV